MSKHDARVEALARALYETDPGTNGYPPLHTSIPWEEISDPTRYERPLQYERAAVILRKIGDQSPGAATRGETA